MKKLDGRFWGLMALIIAALAMLAKDKGLF